MIDKHGIRAKLRAEAIAAGIEPPSEDEEFPTLSAAEATRLAPAEFRARFVKIVEELAMEFGRSGSLADAMPFIKEGHDPRDLTTTQMREIVLANASWFH